MWSRESFRWHNSVKGERAKDFKIAGIQRENLPDTHRVPSRGDKRVEQPFPAKPVFVKPQQPLPVRHGIGCHERHFPRIPPERGPFHGFPHAEWTSKALRIGDDVDELGENPRGECESTAILEEMVDGFPDFAMGRVLRYGVCDQDVGVEPDHAPGSIRSSARALS